jgi:SAM-dependent methyltransferase
MRPYLEGDILEVGSGIGNLTKLLLSQGKVAASDVNETYLRVVEERFRNHPNLMGVVLWDVEKPPPRNLESAVDTIVCCNVLEHTENDNAVLENFHRLLPVDGRLILLVPALKGLYNAFDKELGHFRRYNRQELVEKLTQSGFKVSSLRYFNLFGIVGWYVNGTLLRRRILPARQVGIFNRMVPLFIWAEKVLPAFLGQSLIAVGKKEKRGDSE